jgi:hypothetical protein
LWFRFRPFFLIISHLSDKIHFVTKVCSFTYGLKLNMCLTA